MADGDLLRFIDEVDLSLSQFKTLGMLSEADDELTLKEVAEAMGLSLPAASRAVDGMCQRGYVERREDEVDRRMKRVRIAPAGAEVMDRIKSARIDVIARFLEPLPAEDLDRLAKAIAPVLQRAKADR
jgi:DNA-binding MarR family transcriptional regulator